MVMRTPRKNPDTDIVDRVAFAGGVVVMLIAALVMLGLACIILAMMHDVVQRQDAPIETSSLSNCRPVPLTQGLRSEAARLLLRRAAEGFA